MLKKFVAIYVPSTVNVNIAASAEKIADVTRFVCAKLASRFGGSTVTQATGYWVSETGEIVEDKIQIVKSHYDCEESAAVTYAREIAEFVKQALTQEAVTLETNEGIDFI